MRELRGAERPSPSAPGSSPSIVRLAAGSEHREAVVLGGDLDAAALQVLDRVVGAAVAEGQLEGLEAERPAEQLVAEADAPHGPPPDELAQRLDDVVERRRVAGAVGEEDRVGIAPRAAAAALARARIQRDARAAREQVAHDRALDAGVEHRDPRPVARRRGG